MAGWWVAALHVLPNLLDVKIELELLFKTVPEKAIWFPSGEKLGPISNPGKVVEWDDGQRFGLFLPSRSQQVTPNPASSNSPMTRARNAKAEGLPRAFLARRQWRNHRRPPRRASPQPCAAHSYLHHQPTTPQER